MVKNILARFGKKSPGRHAYADVYDIAGTALKNARPLAGPGDNFKRLFAKSLGNPFLKALFLKGCRSPHVPLDQADAYRAMIRAALEADEGNWDDQTWIESTFSPLAELLDRITSPQWQVRVPRTDAPPLPPRRKVAECFDAALKDLCSVWESDAKAPWFPAYAQVILSGDERMDGRVFMSVLKGLGSFEYRNATVVFALARAWLMSRPDKLAKARKPFFGLSEPLFMRPGWIKHRTAFYDAIFFEHVYNMYTSPRLDRESKDRLAPVLEGLIRFCAVTSKEWLTAPVSGIRHPAITCLPMDESGEPLCRLSKTDWKRKRDLGFGDYVPDVDTTFLTLAMCRKWLDLIQAENLQADPALINECRELLHAHPWVRIIAEYQVGGPVGANPPTIQATFPLDFNGAVPLWFHKPFPKPDGSQVANALGSEICPGHNMDILEAVLLNRDIWNTLEGDNLAFVHRLLDFHHNAFTSGNFAHETASTYYLPLIYVNYAGRLYDTWLAMSPDEQNKVDPNGKVEDIRRIAVEYVRTEQLGMTANPFDAATGLHALVLLRHDKADRTTWARGLGVLLDSLGEGPLKRPWRAYEWTKVNHPVRVIVGSETTTSIFAAGALSTTLDYLYA